MCLVNIQIPSTQMDTSRHLPATSGIASVENTFDNRAALKTRLTLLWLLVSSLHDVQIMEFGIVYAHACELSRAAKQFI